MYNLFLALLALVIASCGQNTIVEKLDLINGPSHKFHKSIYVGSNVTWLTNNRYSTTIPFTSLETIPLLSIKVGKHNLCLMHVDTGAGLGVIVKDSPLGTVHNDNNAYYQLKIATKKGVINQNFYNINDIIVSDVKFDDAIFIVLPDPGHNQLSSKFKVNLCGTIGTSILRSVITEINYKNKFIRFYQSINNVKLAKYISKTKLAIMPSKGNMSYITASLKSYKGLALLDTGATWIGRKYDLGISKEIASKLKIKEKQIVKIKDFMIGSKRFKELRVKIRKMPHPGISFWISSGMLLNYKIVLDYQNQNFYIDDTDDFVSTVRQK